jgi:hypothetical protein
VVGYETNKLMDGCEKDRVQCILTRQVHALADNYGREETDSYSASVCGHILDVRLHLGRGVVVRLQCSWGFRTEMHEGDNSNIKSCSEWHRTMRHPQIPSPSPQSVMVNLLFISNITRSDTSLEPGARSTSLTLAAIMEDGREQRVYTLHQIRSECS